MGKGLLDGYLAGHDDVTHTDEGVLDYLIKTFSIKSMLDIGCGPGGMLDLAKQKQLTVQGVDGDYTLPQRPDRIILDFTKQKWEGTEQYDLGWSVEFVEHVRKEYMENYLAAFDCCKYVLMTGAPPGTPGNHHVNCQPHDFWIYVLEDRGFKYDDAATKEIRCKSSMVRSFIRENGLFFRKA